MIELFHDRTDISIKLYFPSHFQALRKIYCGSFDNQNEQMFKSKFWSDNTGGKSKSKFYLSYNEKFVMKCIDQGEMNMFCEFAVPYFEYMARSFNYKCPTSIGKLLGAYKVKIRQVNSKTSKMETRQMYVILMENLHIGIDFKQLSLSKYDLKGSQARRYVDVPKGKHGVTKLDTNFMEDYDSRPICMNYTMHRLFEIAIFNDTQFFNKYDRVDYSIVVSIDSKKKLIRVGIIDYI